MFDLREKLDRYMPWPMFVATLLFLLLLGIVLHVGHTSPATGAVVYYRWELWLLYPLFVAEFAVHALTRSPRWRQHLLFCLLPPLRLAARDAATGRRIWLLPSGWVEVNEELAERVARTFSGPMIVIALAMVPLLALESIWQHVIYNNALIQLVVDFGTAVIWVAFTVEFVVMVSIVKKRLGYCKNHWIDLAIIVAPMLAFARLLRLGRLLRLEAVARTTRVYRLRGLATRAYKAVMVFEVIQKAFRGKPEKRLARLEEQLAERQRAVCRIQAEIERVREEICQRDATSPEMSEESAEGESRDGGDTVPLVDGGSETIRSPHAKRFSGDVGDRPAVGGVSRAGRE